MLWKWSKPNESAREWRARLRYRESAKKKKDYGGKWTKQKRNMDRQRKRERAQTAEAPKIQEQKKRKI